MTVYLLNTTILTTPGLTYTSQYIGLVQAKSMLGLLTTDADREVDVATGRVPVDVTPVRLPEVVSAIGHQATADIASSLLGIDVAMSREPAKMAPGDVAICVRLRTRAPEGAILTRAEVEAVGYDLVLLAAHDPGQLHAARRVVEIAAELLASPDDTVALPAPGTTEGLAADSVALALGEQRPGTRRRGNYPAAVHYVVRRHPGYGGGYVEVLQEHGTDAWSVTQLTAAEAATRYV